MLFGLPVLLLALAALFMPRRLVLAGRTRTARGLWAVAVLMLAGGWLAGHVASGASAEVLVTPFPGPAVSAAAFAFLGAALIGAEGLLDAADRTAGTGLARKVLIRGTAAASMVLLLAAPLAGFTVWTAQNLLQPTSQTPTQAPAATAGHSGLGTPRVPPGRPVCRGHCCWPCCSGCRCCCWPWPHSSCRAGLCWPDAPGRHGACGPWPS